MTEIAATEIADAGKAFGERLRQATEDVNDATYAAGLGMAWRHQVQLFELMAEQASETLMERCHTKTAHDLFMSHARISFYGLHAQKADLTKWREMAFSAFAEMSAP